MQKVISLIEENIKSITISPKKNSGEKSWGNFFVDMDFNNLYFQEHENLNGYYFFNIHNKLHLLTYDGLSNLFIDALFNKLNKFKDGDTYVILPNNFPEWILTRLIYKFYEVENNLKNYKIIFIRDFLFFLFNENHENFASKRFKINKIIDKKLTVNEYLNLINTHLANNIDIKYEIYSTVGVFINNKWRTFFEENIQIPFSYYFSFNVPVNHSEFTFKVYSKICDTLLIELAAFNINANNSFKDEKYYLKFDFSLNYSGECSLFNDKQEIIKKENISFPNLIYVV